jgi:hypothetical protein
MNNEEPKVHEPEASLPSPFESIMGVVLGKSDDPFAPTPSPYVNAVLDEARRLAEGEAHSESELREMLAVLSAFMGALSNSYMELKKVQDKTHVTERENASIERSFALISSLLERPPAAKDRAAIIDFASLLRSFAVDLLSSFNALNADEQRLPQHSRAPYVNELLRIAQGVIRGDFPAEELKERLVKMVGHWEKSYEDFRVLRLGKPDSVESEEKVGDLAEQYEVMGEALRTMIGALDERNMKKLQTGMAALRNAGEIMMDFFDYIERKMQPPPHRICLRCGTENPPDAKLCSSCHFAIPDFAEKEEAPSSVSFVEGAEKGGSTIVPMNLVKLQESVLGLRDGTCTEDEFAKVLSWLEGKACEGRRQLASFEKPEAFDSPEEEEAYLRAGELLEGAALDLDEGLAELRRYLGDKNEAHLSAGLERCFRGGEKFAELHALLYES